MSLLEATTREELNKMLSQMPPEDVLFLREITARVVRALSERANILVMFPEESKESIELYTRGLETENVYGVLVEAAQIMLEAQATAPSPTTTQ